MGEPAGRWAGEARGTIAGPTSAVCDDRHRSVAAVCFRGSGTSTCRLARLHGVAWSHRLGSDPSVECIYTTVDVAVVQLFYLAMRVWDPRHLPVPSYLCGGPSEQKRIVSSSLIRKLN
jgi:hypothetical protein